MAEPVHILHRQRPVQPKRPPQRLDLLVSSLRTQQNLSHITRNQMHQHENENRYPKEHRDNRKYTPNDILSHNPGGVLEVVLATRFRVGGPQASYPDSFWWSERPSKE